MTTPTCCSSFFFFNDTATTEIYTLSLHDALPILRADGKTELKKQLVGVHTLVVIRAAILPSDLTELAGPVSQEEDRKSTRLNSSHQIISYAVFCLKKKIQNPTLPILYRIITPSFF